MKKCEEGGSVKKGGRVRGEEVRRRGLGEEGGTGKI